MACTSLQDAVEGRVVAITGASQGIGARLAERLAASGGAKVLLVARSRPRLEEVRARIAECGGEAFCYTADLAVEEDCDAVLGQILSDHGRVDIFVSNAGRSIRRSAKYQSGHRFHDFRRLMELNFFGAFRLALGLLPGMLERKSGQIVHISSCGVLSRMPRFTGYCASKAAMDAALQNLAGEVWADGVRTSSVYMPLVRTKMVESPGFKYDYSFLLSVDMACELVEHAILAKRAKVIDSSSRFWSITHNVAPSFITAFNSAIYHSESERPPADVVPPSRKGTLRSTKQANTLLVIVARKIVCSMMWFASRLELLLFVRLRLSWLLRDVWILGLVAVVLVVYGVSSIIVAICRAPAGVAARASLHGATLLKRCAGRRAANLVAAPSTSAVSPRGGMPCDSVGGKSTVSVIVEEAGCTMP